MVAFGPELGEGSCGGVDHVLGCATFVRDVLENRTPAGVQSNLADPDPGRRVLALVLLPGDAVMRRARDRALVCQVSVVHRIIIRGAAIAGRHVGRWLDLGLNDLVAAEVFHPPRQLGEELGIARFGEVRVVKLLYLALASRPVSSNLGVFFFSNGRERAMGQAQGGLDLCECRHDRPPAPSEEVADRIGVHLGRCRQRALIEALGGHLVARPLSGRRHAIFRGHSCSS